MHLTLLSLAFLIPAIPFAILNLIVPGLNLHLCLSREQELIKQAQQVLDSHRLNLSGLQSDLRSIKIKGIEINAADLDLSNDAYAIAKLRFSHKNLLTNFYFGPEQMPQNKAIELIIDKVT
jgi:hypothetical protein